MPVEPSLTLLVRSPELATFVGRLREHRDRLLEARIDGTEPPTPIRVTRAEALGAREAFDRAVARGESRLHALAWLLAERLLGTSRIELRYHLFCEPAGSRGGKRILIVETVSLPDLQEVSDLRLTSRLASRHRYAPDGGAFEPLRAIAGMLEFQPLESKRDSLALKLTTRVKAEEEIFRKLTDEVFEVDRLLARDKQLSPFSKYIKDTFGMKIVTHGIDACYDVAECLHNLEVDPARLASLGALPPDFDASAGNARRVTLLESKDYIRCPPDQKKKTGWEALKNVYAWAGDVFEIQIQTEANYGLEISDLGRVSHTTFAEQRARLRERLEAELPLYGEFQSLLKWLAGPFALGEEVAPPARVRAWVEVA